MNKQTLKIFLIVDLIVVLIYAGIGEFIWLLNTQIALISSLLVTIGSYIGYKKNIQSRAKEHVNDDDNYDEVDKMDDSYDLYSPEVEQVEILEPTKEEVQEAMKPIKQNHFANFKCAFSGMASFYRLIGYIFLIIGFFYLNNNGYLHIYSYIIGFVIVPVSALLAGVYLRKS
ncbi:MAG: hypothetical protein U9N59_04230 [Campylobacterota bacterium]|nr:hypothetical protein [Campylobacterota bacterium]